MPDRLVIDASVVAKWFLSDESDKDAADKLLLLLRFARRSISHWMTAGELQRARNRRDGPQLRPAQLSPQ